MESVLDRLRDKFGNDILATTNFRGDESIIVTRKTIVPLMTYLKNQMAFDMLVDLCGVDYYQPTNPSYGLRHSKPEALAKWRAETAPVALNERFEVVYHLYSTPNKYRIRVKVRVDAQKPEIETITTLWKAANWFEREAFDLYGIRFLNHPNLKRILTYPEFEGHPLRKDYPIARRGVIPTPDTLLDELEKRKQEAREARRKV